MPAPTPRPRRGTPSETRARLVEAAVRELDRAGFHGTDTNRIAREAGYSPATFYKHFPDKRAVFIEAYRAWVDEEWGRIAAVTEESGSLAEAIPRIVDEVFAAHARHAGLRASLRELVHSDPEVRRVYRASRRRQLATLAKATAHRRREADAILLFVVERIADALADGEARALGLVPNALRSQIVEMISARFGSQPKR